MDGAIRCIVVIKLYANLLKLLDKKNCCDKTYPSADGLTKKAVSFQKQPFAIIFFLKNYFTFSAKAAPALNLTTFLAAILISLPV